MDGFRLNFIGR